MATRSTRNCRFTRRQHFVRDALVGPGVREPAPRYKGRIYWKTIPPGLLMKQLKAGGTIMVGKLAWTNKPDIYMAA